MMTIEIFVFAFFTYFILDIVWTKYTQAVAQSDILGACCWSAVIPVLSALLVWQYILNPYALIPMALGAATGTWFAMTYLKKV